MSYLPSVKLSGEEIRKAASEAFIILKQRGFQACLVGGAACAMYGMKHREPNDVDILVMTEKDTEEIKRLIFSSNDKFYLVPSTNPRNTYKVLWFTLSVGRSCKVDILVPGIMSIPKVPSAHISYVKNFKNIPIAPFLVVLLLKLRAWTDHSVDNRSRMRAKVPVDIRDIEELLEIGVKVYKAHLDKEPWLPESFVRESKERVRRYTIGRTWVKKSWEQLGFITPSSRGVGNSYQATLLSLNSLSIWDDVDF